MLFFFKNILVHIVAPESHVLIYLKLGCFEGESIYTVNYFLGENFRSQSVHYTYQFNKKQTNNFHFMHFKGLLSVISSVILKRPFVKIAKIFKDL